MNPREEWSLPTRHVGRHVLVYDSVDSTNTVAAALSSDPDNAGTVVLAAEQTAGRGQHGRQWECPAGAGVLMSVLLFPPPHLRCPAILTAWAAVSVCETIRHVTGLQARIKWPNDVLIRGKKVCGILIEQGAATVAGIGLNVNQPAQAFNAPGLTDGRSLRLFTGTTHDCADVARLLVAQLDEEYQRLVQGDLATLEACWKWRLGLLGRRVAVECVDRVYYGRLRDVAFAGLHLKSDDGKNLHLTPESVQHLEPAGNISS